VGEKLRMLAEEIDAISIEHNMTSLWQVCDKKRKELMHVLVASKSWPYYPGVDSSFPLENFVEPFFE
jgi:hypothetical protein